MSPAARLLAVALAAAPGADQPTAARLLAAAPGADQPTRADLNKAVEDNGAAVVEVLSGKSSGTGMVVGEGGQIITSTRWVKLDAATVRVGGVELPARVIFASAKLKIAVIQIEAPQGLRAAAVHLRTAFEKGETLVGIRRGKKALEPTRGRVLSPPTAKVPFFDVELALPPGSPIFDASRKLVAISVQQRGIYSCRALPIAVVKAQLEAQASKAAP